MQNGLPPRPRPANLPPMVDLDELLAKLKSILRGLRAEYLQPHDSPWIVGFSVRKDSTATNLRPSGELLRQHRMRTFMAV